MSKILIVDDEYRIREIIKKYAVYEGYDVVEATDGLQAISLCAKERFDLIIMDIMMPQVDGFEACKKIRRRFTTPILILTARGEEYDKIHGFEIGADDYVVKPFSPKELMMRVNAIIRRSKAEGLNKNVFSYKGLHADFNSRIITVDGESVDFTPKEYELFFFLVKHKGEALTRERILNEIWGYNSNSDDRTLDTHIKLLRKSLKEYSKCIVTLRGVGYRLDAQD